MGNENLSNETLFVSHGQLVHDLAILKMQRMDSLPDDDSELISRYIEIAVDINDALNDR